MHRWGLWWGSLEGVALPALVVAAGAAGFTEVSCTPAMYFACRADGWHDGALRTLLDDHAVTVSMVDPLLRGLPGACDPAQVAPRWRSTFEHGEDDCHRVADALGCELVNVAHFLGAPTPEDALVDALGILTARAAARGRRVAIEAMPEGAIPDITTAARLVAGVAHASCGITLDTWHWWRSGGALAELDALAPGTVFALQVSDATDAVRGTGANPPDRDRRLPGRGALPLAAIVSWARHRHPAAHLGLEVFDRAAPGDDAERAHAAARAVADLEAQVAYDER